MALEIYEWNSFSCNNSSDYRLVARFESPQAASAMKKTLAKFFTQHAVEQDEFFRGYNDDEYDYDEYFDKVSAAAEALGKKYGHQWREPLHWGDGDGHEGDEPGVWSVGDTVVVYHTYMGGFGDLSKVLAKAGATLVDKGEVANAPVFRVEFDLPVKDPEAFEAELQQFFAQRHTQAYKSDWELRSEANDCAWGEGNGSVGDVTFALENGHCVFTYSMRPDYLENLQAYLKKTKVRSLTIRVASKQDVAANRKDDKRITKANAKNKSKAVAKATKPPKTEAIDPNGESFLFTGKLAAMTRAEAEARAKALGGSVAKSVTPTLGVLVVGDDGSPLYGDGAKGSKQTKAETLNGQGAGIRIISETAFLLLEKP